MINENQSQSSGSDQTPGTSFEPCLSILIADDNDGVREALVAALRSRGYLATGARNGKDAIQKLATMPGPTLIFMDLMMPVMNGWEALEIWSRDPAFSKNKIVTISAVNLKSRLDARIPKNTVGSLQKPLTVKSVFTLVQEFCGRPVSSSLSAATVST
ncbi:MAG: response regulator [Proteobacteria bacterium]|nr:MAG: response regulator [Pseudomonadota bacterium]